MSARCAAGSRANLGVRALWGLPAGAWLALAAVPAVLFGLTLLAVENRWAPLLGLDGGARDALHGYGLTHGGFVAAMAVISGCGSALAWLLVLGVVAAWLAWRRLARLALFAVVTAGGSSLLNTVVKSAVHRVRPVLAHPVAQEVGWSFPSAHAQGAMVGYAVLLLVLLPILPGPWRTAALAFGAFMVLAIGFSRVALGVHYVSDVVGGLVLGAAWVAVMAAAFTARGTGRRRGVAVGAGLDQAR